MDSQFLRPAVTLTFSMSIGFGDLARTLRIISVYDVRTPNLFRLLVIVLSRVVIPH